MKIYTTEQHRARIRNINDAEKSVKSCLRRHRVHDYLYGQCTYNLGDYPVKFPLAPSEYDYNMLKELADNGVQLIQIHEEWNDTARIHGADKFSTYDPEGLKQFIDLVHSLGMKIIPYISSGYFDIHDPNFRECFAQTDRYCINGQTFEYRRCSAGSAEWRSFVLPRTVEILDRYDFDGIYNDCGTDSNYIINQQLQKPGLGYYDPEIEDMLGILYGEVKKRGGIYKIHCDGASGAPCLDRVYDYLWIGEAVKDIGLGLGKNYPDYLVPCPDFSRGVVGTMESHFVKGIPFLQFPLLMRGRPFLGQHTVQPGVKYYGGEQEEAECWHMARVRAYMKEHPNGPYVYSHWSSLGEDDKYYELWKKYLKLYTPMVEEASVVYLEIRECEDILSKLPEEVIATMFVNEEKYLVVSNMSAMPYGLVLRDVWIDRETDLEGKQFTIQPGKALFLRMK